MADQRKKSNGFNSKAKPKSQNNQTKLQNTKLDTKTKSHNATIYGMKKNSAISKRVNVVGELSIQE
jgi:hypothetical protein